MRVLGRSSRSLLVSCSLVLVVVVWTLVGHDSSVRGLSDAEMRQAVGLQSMPGYVCVEQTVDMCVDVNPDCTNMCKKCTDQVVYPSNCMMGSGSCASPTMVGCGAATWGICAYPDDCCDSCSMTCNMTGATVGTDPHECGSVGRCNQ